MPARECVGFPLIRGRFHHHRDCFALFNKVAFADAIFTIIGYVERED